MRTDTRDEALLDELAEEFAERLRRGERPAVEEYREAYPHLADAISQLFPTIAIMEDAGGLADDATADPEPLPPGTRLGHFRIIEWLGEGGTGAVYLAEDEELGKPVAVKVPCRQRFSSATELAAFLDEARTAAGLEHPAIVPVHYFGREPDGTNYLVMKYLEGGSLAERLRDGPLDSREAAEILVTIAEAVGYLHRQGFVHRDLKPLNILFDRERRPYVADFGLALHAAVQGRRAGDRSGTLRYMAPEQVRGEAQWLDGRADVWALGAIFYEMLAGQPAFVSEGAAELAEEILHREPRPPRQLRESLSAELERICLKCLAKDATQRYPTASDLAADLRRWLRPRRRHAALAACAAVGVVLVIVVAGLWGSGRSTIAPAALHGTSAPAALTGAIGIRVWNPQAPGRNGLGLGDPGALPLRPGDQIRVEARLNRPAYAYLVWIDSQGAAWPVYPWTPGDWAARPAQETPQERLTLPEATDEGWPMQGPRGMETLLLLARDAPLPAGLRLETLLAGLPRQACQDPQAIVWFENGRPVAVESDRLRGPNFADPRQIPDPVLQTQELLRGRLSSYFPVMRAVSVANQGE